jgi:uncharacterized protein (DUF1697 family)
LTGRLKKLGGKIGLEPIRYIALLHSIGLGGGRRLAMADLREMAGALGLTNPRTLIATGNLVFEATGVSKSSLEGKLEAAFEKRFDHHVDIVVRTLVDWRRMMAGNPFQRESKSDGSRVIVRVARSAISDDALALLEERGGDGERIKIVEDYLWVHFPKDPGKSRLIGALTTKRLGVGTLRNWNTVRRLCDFAET